MPTFPVARALAGLAALFALAACGRDTTAPAPARAIPAPTTLQTGGVPLLALVPDAAVTDTIERRRLADLRAAPRHRAPVAHCRMTRTPPFVV